MTYWKTKHRSASARLVPADNVLLKGVQDVPLFILQRILEELKSLCIVGIVVLVVFPVGQLCQRVNFGAVN